MHFRPPLATGLILLALLSLPVRGDAPLRVAQDRAWPPFSYVDEKGRPQGMLVDLWRALGKQMGREVAFHLVDWQQSLVLVRDDGADVHAGLFRSPSRDAYLDFSDPLLPLTTRLFISADLNARSFQELGEVPVGITRGGFEEEFVRTRFPGVRLRGYDNNRLMIQAAFDGRIRAFVADYPVGMYYLHSLGSPEQFQVVHTLYTQELRSAVARGNGPLLDHINRALRQLPAPERERITQKWLLARDAPPAWLLPLAIGLAVALLVIGVLAYTLVLRIQVRRHTRQLSREIEERTAAERSLRESSERYRSVIETARDGFWVVDREARILEVNDAYCRLSGYSREELLGMTITDLDLEEDGEKTARRTRAIMQQGSDLFVTRHRRKDGESWPVEVSVSHSTVENGRFFVFLRDIQERELARRLADLRQQLGEIVYQGDMEQLMQTALDAAEALTESRIGFFHFVEQDQENLSLQVWSTRTLREMCFAEGKGLHYPISEAGVWVDCIHRRRPVIHNDYAALPHKKGMPEGHPPLIREITVPVFRDNLIVAVLGVGDKARDYTPFDLEQVNRVADMAFDFVERRQAEQRIEHMAYYDLLTGLPNRALLSDRLGQAMAQHRRSRHLLAVCYLDLNGFKPVNDRFGHDVGDILLTRLSARFKEMLREGDTLARIGGDEFVFLLTELSTPHEGEVIVQRLLDAIDTPFEIKAHRIAISGSMGITLYPTDDADADLLLRHADQAMYQAKASGRAAYRLYDPVQDQRLRVHRETLEEIVDALRRREFVLHYQPRVALDSGRVVGVESLIRWHSPARGLLLPGRFLPYVEGTAEEIALGEWTVKTALDQLTAWRARGLTLPVSVNISPKHIQTPGFADFLASLLAHYPQGTAELLELEVLENSAIGDIARVAEVMNACTALGVHFSLDDFGTGYSSLTYFHRLPIDILKIDQNFVRNMLDDVSDLDIVEGVLRLSQALKRPVVAEGVESVELGLLLLHLGCRFAQGFGIARPMPPEALPAWIGEWEKDSLWHRLQQAEPDGVDDVELKVAIFSLRRWLDGIFQHIATGSGDPAPSLDDHRCLFGRWYGGLGQARYGNRPIYAFIPPKHTRVHELANTLVARARAGEPERARAGLDELQAAGEELIDMLRRLAVR